MDVERAYDRECQFHGSRDRCSAWPGNYHGHLWNDCWHRPGVRHFEYLGFGGRNAERRLYAEWTYVFLWADWDIASRWLCARMWGWRRIVVLSTV